MRMGIAPASGLLFTLPACAPQPWAPPEGCEVEEPTTLPLVLSVHRDLDLVFVIDDGIEVLRVTEAITPRGAIEVTCRYREHASDGSPAPDFSCDGDNDASSPCREGMIWRAEDDRCGLGGTGLVCDALRLTCAPRCERDEECPVDRSLRPGVCDRRTVAEAARARGLPLWLLGPERLDVPRRVCGTLDCRAP